MAVARAVERYAEAVIRHLGDERLERGALVTPLHCHEIAHGGHVSRHATSSHGVAAATYTVYTFHPNQVYRGVLVV